jgi:hypothetical protein
MTRSGWIRAEAGQWVCVRACMSTTSLRYGESIDEIYRSGCVGKVSVRVRVCVSFVCVRKYVTCVIHSFSCFCQRQSLRTTCICVFLREREWKRERERERERWKLEFFSSNVFLISIMPFIFSSGNVKKPTGKKRITTYEKSVKISKKDYKALRVFLSKTIVFKLIIITQF